MKSVTYSSWNEEPRNLPRINYSVPLPTFTQCFPGCFQRLAQRLESRQGGPVVARLDGLQMTSIHADSFSEVLLRKVNLFPKLSDFPAEFLPFR